MNCKQWCLDIVIPESVKLGSFGHNVKYIGFNEIKKGTERAYSCDGIFGFIVYEDDQRIQFSKKVLVKFLSTVYWNKAPTLTFLTEIVAYNKVLPYFSKYYKNIQNLFPKFYYGTTSSFEGIDRAAILLEHSPDEFKLTEQVPFLDFKHLSLMIKEIAKFHACSYIAKKEEKVAFNLLVKNLHETFFSFYDVNPGFAGLTSNRAVNPLKSHPKYKNKLNGILDIIRDADEFLRKVLSPKNDKINVICHGDFLATNAFFKYDFETGEPNEIIFFDLANARYASPITDIALFLYLQTDQKSRDRYWNELLNCYYDSLAQTVPVEYLPTKQEIFDEFKEKSVIAYIIASFYLPILLDTEREDPAIREKVIANEFENIDERVEELGKLYNDYGGQKATDILTDIIMDMIDRGYI